MADGAYRGNPEVIIPYRKPADGTTLRAADQQGDLIGTVVSVVVPAALSDEVASASAQRQAAVVLLPPSTIPTVER